MRQENADDEEIRGPLGALGLISYAQIAIAQGLYFFIGGIWPLVSIGSFLAVTGPKTDIWLVYTVGLLLAVNGAVLASAGLRHKVSLEIFLVAIGSALALAGIEVVYVARGRISYIYLLDALIELGVITLWWVIGLRAAGTVGALIERLRRV